MPARCLSLWVGADVRQPYYSEGYHDHQAVTASTFSDLYHHQSIVTFLINELMTAVRTTRRKRRLMIDETEDE